MSEKIWLPDYLEGPMIVKMFKYLKKKFGCKTNRTVLIHLITDRFEQETR